MGKRRLTPGTSKIHDKLPREKESSLAAKKVTKKGANLNFRSSSGQPKIKSKPFPIVGLGASAGGLEAFTDLLRHLPSDTGMALVLIQHLDPKHESMFSLLLSKATQMAVREAKDREAVEPNHVYVIPPNTEMTISKRVLSLTPREETYGRHMVIDRFFRSLAEDQRSNAIGIILSGTASDGALGLKAIKAEGGITFAQDEKSAKYGGMPHNAVAAGGVDFILPPEGIAKELIRISRSPYVLSPAMAVPVNKPEEIETSGLNSEEELRKKIFSLLLTSSGVDFAYYKHATVERRIMRRMVLRKMESLRDYVEYLRNNPGELDALYQDILIHATGFFRDPKTFETLKKEIFPIILKQRSPEEVIRVWVPGCSTGEEAYSLAIALMEFLGERSQNISIQIFATDISETALEKARAGIYTGNTTSGISPERLRRFFIQVENGYQVSKPIREICVFARHDLTKDPPFSNLDLISCRNVLIYMGPLLQKRAMGIFHYALKPAGYLFLGKTESLGGFSEFFVPVDKQHKVFSRKTTATRLNFGFVAGGYEIKQVNSIKGVRKEGFDLEEEADRIVLSKYAPAGVVINEHMDILHFRGRTGSYIEPSPGAASWNLLKMAREGLKLELRNPIHEARKKDVAVRKEGLQIQSDGEFREVNVEVLPIKSPPGEKFFLILFEEVGPAHPKKGLGREEISPAGVGVKGGRKGKKETSKTVQLERELAATKKYLQSIIEEGEATNEELRAANEEILSSNEEFQSVNEELETSRQELQSTNEELTTLNDELHNRNAELGQLNNDMINLLGSANLPIVMLTEDLRIRRFTLMAEKILNLIPTDVGRSITDINLGINLPDLESQVLEVISTVAAKEIEITDRKDCWYSLQIRPYRTTDNKIDGVVLVFADIDALKKSAEKIKESLNYAEGIIETVREPLLILDKDLKVKTANRSFYMTFQAKPEETENRFIYDLGDRQWDVPELKKLLGEILPRNTQFQDFEVECEFPNIGRRVMLLNARQINQPANGLKLVLLAIEDITERKRSEKEKAILGEQLRQLQKMEALGTMAGGIAHDFNNLLNPIFINTELVLLDAPLEDRMRQYLQRVLQAAERGRNLVKQIITFSRQKQQERTPLTAGLVIKEALEFLRSTLPQTVEIRENIQRETASILADPTQIHQVVMNLCSNAAYAMREQGGLLEVGLAEVEVDEDMVLRHPDLKPGPYLRLTVTDTGTGMTQKVMERAFDPFFTTKKVGEGSGMGLSVVQGIVRAHGGAITAYSEVGKGSTFNIFFPRLEAESPTVDVSSGPIATGSERILLVEDEKVQAESVRNMLGRLGYAVVAKTDSREALALFQQDPQAFDLVISDQTMPGMTGGRLAEELLRIRPDLPIIFCTGFSERMDANGAQALGVRQFLMKPFSIREMAETIRRALEKT